MLRGRLQTFFTFSIRKYLTVLDPLLLNPILSKNVKNEKLAQKIADQAYNFYISEK